MLGSLIAFIWTSCMGSMQLEAAVAIYQNITFMSLLLLSVLSATTALIPSLETISLQLSESAASASFASLVFTVFFFGSFSKAGLEALCPKVVKARLAGVLLGLSAVLLCYETVLSRSNTPPKMQAGIQPEGDPEKWPQRNPKYGPWKNPFEEVAGSGLCQKICQNLCQNFSAIPCPIPDSLDRRDFVPF